MRTYFRWVDRQSIWASAVRRAQGRLWVLVSGAFLLGVLTVLLRGNGTVLRSETDFAEPATPTSAELFLPNRDLLRRLERKHDVIQALLAGRIDLLEAAAHFGALNRQPPDFDWDQFRRMTPGADDEERLCRSVINFACVELGNSAPTRVEEVRDYYNRVLQEYLDRGPLRLPPVTDFPGADSPGDSSY
jgi:hypothetical protein